MPKAVFDTTILVSAFLRPVSGGASYDLLHFVERGATELFICDEILEETARVLVHDEGNRLRYVYSEEDVVVYCQELMGLGTIMQDVPEVRGVVVRDPNDDMVVACALAASADYIVTRDKDLLSLEKYEGITMIAPEDFLHVLRGEPQPPDR